MRKILAAALAVCIGGVPCATPADQPASLDLLRRATDPNPGLNSYTASAQLTATLHVLLAVKKSFSGRVYYLKPKRKIEFDNVPSELAKFKDLVQSTPSYAEAVTQYAIAPLTDDGSESTYSLVPKKPGGRVKNVTVRVNDQAALIDSATWSYVNGGTLSFSETYATVSAYRLPSAASIEARFPEYSVDGTIAFSNYAPNAPVSPSVFQP